MEIKITIPEIMLWCDKCGGWKNAKRLTFGEHFVDVQCSECLHEQPYSMTKDTVHSANEIEKKE